jgi:hypothetical protein
VMIPPDRKAHDD